MRKLMSKKGFTLVELMIVVVILGILVAVAVPIFGAVTKNARIKSCKSNQRVIKGNLETYQMTGNNGEQFDIDETTDVSTDPGFKKLFDGNELPKCPSNDGDGASYNAKIEYAADTGAITYLTSCLIKTTGEEIHN